MSKKPSGELQYFLSYAEERASLSVLTDAQAGRLYKAKYDYFFDATEPDFSDDTALRVIWSLVGPKLEKNRKDAFVKSLQGAYRVYQRDFAPDEMHPEPLTIGQWLESRKRYFKQTGFPCPTAFRVISPEDL